MKNALKSIACHRGCSSSASVVDGKLILSFPHASTPVVWQMDLDNAKASALEVREGKTPGAYTLVLKTPKGESIDIAPFENRAQAVEGLMAAARALENAHGQIRPAAAMAPGPAPQRAERRAPRRWFGILAGLLVLAALLTLWVRITPHPPMRMSSPGDGNTGAAIQAPGAEPEAGVPFSADDYLKGR